MVIDRKGFAVFASKIEKPMTLESKTPRKRASFSRRSREASISASLTSAISRTAGVAGVVGT